MAELKTPREPLIHVLLEANKRASTALTAAREVSGKLFGPRPEESVASMPEMSCAGLAARLIGTISELEDELGRQHNGLGEPNTQAVTQQGNRAVAGY